MNFKIAFYLMVIIGAISFTSCEQSEGKGGTSTIRGRIFVKEYNGDFTILKDTIPLQNEDVFIIYGTDEIYGDRFKTDYEGYYEFNYLQEGMYTIYTYSKDSTLNYDLTKKMVPVFREVQISGTDQIIEVDDIYIIN